MGRLLIFYCGDPGFHDLFSDLFSVEKLWERELGIAVAEFCELLLNPIWILISLTVLTSSQLSYPR